jgi:sigma-B regulation protein RsbU (phosphoserine phosphatase)
MAATHQDLHRELINVRREKAAFQALARLVDHFLKLVRSSAEERILSSILQQAVQVAVDLTGAQKGALFLLNRDGAVTDSILTREGVSAAEKSALIGRVLDRGLAAWVREHRLTGLVLDSREDKRWLDLPDQPYTVRSALAVPILRGEDLMAILTLLHADPGRFGSETVQLMELTAVQLGMALESARLYAERDRYSRALDAELEKGRRIQLDFLPAVLPELSGWEIAAHFLPARQVSGDFYDAFELPSGRLCFAIGDVCDKGVGSALYMALIRSLIRVFSQLADSGTAPVGSPGRLPPGVEAATAHRVVRDTNQYLAREHGGEGMFASLIIGVLDPGTGRLAYVNAGHEPGLIVGASGIRARIAPTGPLIGVLPEASYQVRDVEIHTGETVFAYTDGVTESLSKDNAAYTRRRLIALAGAEAVSARGVIDTVIEDIAAHTRNAPQFDDITLIALRRRA